MSNQIIIDTDPGVDDALAIAFATASDLRVSALTTVYGNVGVKQTTVNACALLQTLGSDIPVYMGAMAPVCGRAFNAIAHGDNGLGGFEVTPLSKQAEQQNAVEYIIHTLQHAEKQSVTLVVIGPSTNISLAFSMRPELVSSVKELVIMGGVFDAPGNVSPVAEFNVMNDPYALSNILSFDCKKTMVPADVCRQVLFTKSDFDQLDSPKLKDSLGKIIDAYIGYYTSDDEHAGFTGGVMYDVLTIAYLLDPSLFTYQTSDVYVETRSGESFGQTIARSSTEHNTQIMRSANASGIKQLFFSTLNTSQ